MVIASSAERTLDRSTPSKRETRARATAEARQRYRASNFGSFAAMFKQARDACRAPTACIASIEARRAVAEGELRHAKRPIKKRFKREMSRGTAADFGAASPGAPATSKNGEKAVLPAHKRYMCTLYQINGLCQLPSLKNCSKILRRRRASQGVKVPGE